MFQSNALWPRQLRSVSSYGDCISTDIHGTRESAQAVCSMLELHGFAADGEIFPLRTWVSEVQQPPVIPAP